MANIPPVKFKASIDSTELDAQLREIKAKLEAWAASVEPLLTFTARANAMGGVGGNRGAVSAGPPPVPQASMPPFLGQTGGAGATQMAQPGGGFVPNWKAIEMDARYRQALTLSRGVTGDTQTSIHRNLARDEIDLVNAIKKLSTAAERAANQVRSGGNVPAARLAQLNESNAYLQSAYQAQFADMQNRFDPQSILARAQKANSEYAAFQKRSADYRRANSSTGQRLMNEAKNIQADVRSVESIVEGQNYLSTVGGNLAYANTGTGASGGGSGMNRFRTGHMIASHFLPIIGTLTSASLLSKSYEVGSQFATSAGMIGMQTGGANPNVAYNKLLSVGAPLGFSASQVSQAAQLQGQYAGTGNMAFLFKDSMQTAQFARYLGISGQTAASIMGGYQLAGAFSAGNEKATAQSIAAAAQASGVNSQQFMSGLQQLTNIAMRTSIFTKTNGPAQVLSVANQLGSSLGIPLFTGAQAPATLESMQQSFSAGPGQGSGMTAGLLLPMYTNALKTPYLTSMFKKLGVSNPVFQMADMMNSNQMLSNPQVMGSVLSTFHKEMQKGGIAQGQTGLQLVANFLNGGQGATISTLQMAQKIAGPNFMGQLSKAEASIKAASGSELQRQTNYMQSISQNTMTTNMVLDRILGTIGGAVIPATALTAGAFNVSPGASALGATGVSSVLALAHVASPFLLGAAIAGGGLGATVRGIAGMARGAGAVVRGGMSSLAGVGGDAAAAADVAGAGSAFGMSALANIAAPLAVLIKAPSAAQGFAAQQASFDKAFRARLLHNMHAGASAALTHASVATHAALHTGSTSGATKTFQDIANVGQSPGFRSFVDAFINPHAAYAATSAAMSGGSFGGFNASTSGFGFSPSGGFSFTPTGITTAAQKHFVSAMLPYAKKAAAALGVSSTSILGQWGYESAFGTSEAATLNKNFGGIGPNRGIGVGADSSYAGYSSLSQFEKNYVQVIKQKQYSAARNKMLSAYGYGYNLTTGGYDTTAPGVYAAGVQSDANVVNSIIRANNHKDRPSSRHNLRHKAKATQSAKQTVPHTFW